jgi:hypothetical protein
MTSLVREALRLLRTPKKDRAGAEGLAKHLMAEDLPHLAAADGGIWAWPLYKAAAEAAVRIQAAAVGGDEM